MLTYMMEIQATAESLIQDKLNFVTEELEAQLNMWKAGVDKKQTFNDIMYKKFTKILSNFKVYCSQIPVLGFNSAKYDLNLIKKTIAKNLELDETKHGFVVKKNNAYSCISNENFKFLDISNYLAGGSSYSRFLAAFKVSESKGYFPYEYFDSPERLEETCLPPHEAFYSSLKQSNITDEQYNYLQKVWAEKDMKTFRDLLTWYNNLDVEPFAIAVERLQKFYRDNDIDIFKTTISVPGIARQMVFKSAKDEGAYFSLIDKKNADLYYSLLESLTGGPSIIFTRKAIANETFIRNGNKPVRKVIGLDANALYLWAFDQEFPVGSFIRRLSKDNFKPIIRDWYNSMFHWMDYISKTENIKILHKRNSGKEKRDGRFLCDGYCATTNTVFNYDGCYWHAHSCQKEPETEKDKQRFEIARQRTKDRDEYYKSLGYNVRTIRECEFRKEIKSDPKLKEFIKSQRPKYFKNKCMTEQEILNDIKSNKMFGVVEVDIQVPSHLYDKFSEMSPLFCTSDIPFQAIGRHMEDFVNDVGLSKKPRRLLVGGMKAKKIMLTTPLIKWYLENGLEVTKIYQVAQYQKMRCFKNFVKQITDARRAGDADKDLSIIADLNKLIGNSAYGSTIMNKLKHSKVRYIQGENQACLLANQPTFKSMTELSQDFFEVEMNHNKIKLDLPIQIGFFILNYAKLRMLAFYQEFLSKFIEKQDFEMLQMDTDSFYFSIAGNSLDEVIKPNLKQEYINQIMGHCNSKDVNAETHWLPRKCCDLEGKYDSRTPGLFKVEYTGDTFYGLCSKTYIVQNGEEFKFSSKGISKRRVKYPVNIYKSVLETKQSSGSSNVGFISKNNKIYTYNQHRNGFSYFYCKRKVCDDGIGTEPLDITLQPIPSKFRKIESFV